MARIENLIRVLLTVLLVTILAMPSKGQALHDSNIYEVTVGSTITLTLGSAYQRTLSGATNISYSWTSASTNNAAVQSSTKNYAVIKGVSPTNGTINIYYQCSYFYDGYYRTMNFYFMVKVNSSQVLVSSIILNPSNTVELSEGETVQFTATVLPTNAANKNVNWWSDNTSIATVSSNGLVTARSKEGLAKITCSATDNSGVYCVGYVSVKNSGVKITGFWFHNSPLNLQIGETQQLYPIILPSNASNKTMQWSSSDETVATVTSTGKVTGVGYGAASITATTTDGTNISQACAVTVAPPITSFTDGSPYDNQVDMAGLSVSYTRNFTSTNWQALYIPFQMKYEDWADKADVAYINNVHQWDDDNDGEIDRTVLEFITKKSGSIEANKPYVIRPKQTGKVTFTSENTTLYAAPETDGYVDCMSTTTKYTLYGTYQEKTDMYAKGYYAMVNGGFRQAESASVTLAPFRTYLKIESRTGAGTVQQAKRINIMVDGVMDNEATEIGETSQNSSLETQNIYSLSGQKVNSNYKGIAIKNGKKYISK